MSTASNLGCLLTLVISHVAVNTVQAQTSAQHWQSAIANASLRPSSAQEKSVALCGARSLGDSAHQRQRTDLSRESFDGQSMLLITTQTGSNLIIAARGASLSELSQAVSSTSKVRAVIRLGESSLMSQGLKDAEGKSVQIVEARRQQGISSSSLFSAAGSDLDEWSAVFDRVTLTAYTVRGGGPGIAAAVTRSTDGGKPVIDVLIAGGETHPSPSAVKLAAIEHAYVAARRLSESEAYNVGIAGLQAYKAALALRHASQWAALRWLAVARACVAADLARRGVSVSLWRVVEITNVVRAQATKPVGAEVVAVRARTGAGPAVGVVLLLARRPHKECGAKTDIRGYAECALVDLDPHPAGSGHHDDAPDGRVIATSSGRVRDEVVDLPSATVLVDLAKR